MNRREFIRNTSLATSTVLLGSAAWAADSGFPVVRTPEAKRKFKSPTVEQTIDTCRTRACYEIDWL